MCPKNCSAYAAHFAEDFEDARGFGWDVGPVRFSWPDLIRAKDREIDRLNQIYLSLLSESGVTLYPQRGRFVDPHRLQVGTDTVSAERILIATGGRPWVPDIPGIEYTITSDEAFDLPELPNRVAVVGGGYIACEFAGIFNGLGSEVFQLYRGDAVLRGFDHDVRRVVGAEMQNKGIQLMLETTVERIRKTAQGLELSLRDGGTLEVDQVMYATGRVPNVKGMKLQDIGLDVRPGGGVVVNDFSQTNLDHIYAVGDVTNRVNPDPGSDL